MNGIFNPSDDFDDDVPRLEGAALLDSIFPHDDFPKRVALAVLAKALADLRDGQTDVLLWLFDDTLDEGGFIFWCEVAGFNAEAIRTMTLRAVQRKGRQDERDVPVRQ